jgi:hypothetical protein
MYEGYTTLQRAVVTALGSCRWTQSPDTTALPLKIIARRFKKSAVARHLGWFVGVGRGGLGGVSGWGEAVFVGSSGCETIVVGRCAAGCFVTWVGIGVRIDARWGRRRVGIGASRGRAQRGVSGRWWAGRPASPVTSRLSPSPVRRFWTAPTPIRALVAPRIPIARLNGTPASPSRASMAPRIPFTARIGVGAVQNRRQYHRVISTVCGDAGRPAHQRPETPRCATHHHDRFAPVCGPTARRFPPRCTI